MKREVPAKLAEGETAFRPADAEALLTDGALNTQNTGTVYRRPLM